MVMVNVCVMIRGKDSITGRVNMPVLEFVLRLVLALVSGLAGLQD